MKKYIYKITNLINNKIYVGQTNNFLRRKQQHINAAISNKGPNKYLYNSMRKYGIENFAFEVIEYVDNYNEREQYWIKFYNSNVPAFGYNIDFRELNKSHIGKKSQNDMNQLYNDLQYSDISFEELAKKYHFKNIDNIRAINRGIYYYNSKFSYPIRDTKFSKAYKKTSKIIQDLQNMNLSINEIANKYKTTPSYIYSINSGRRNFRKDIQYPIRKTQTRKPPISFSKKDIDNIKSDIKNTNLKWEELVQKYGGNTKIYQHINNGKTYFDENENYPLRTKHNTRKLEKKQIESIISELKNSALTQKDIAKKFKVSQPVIRKINKGIEPYFNQNEKYPIRTK